MHIIEIGEHLVGPVIPDRMSHFRARGSTSGILAQSDLTTCLAAPRTVSSDRKVRRGPRRAERHRSALDVVHLAKVRQQIWIKPRTTAWLAGLDNMTFQWWNAELA